jgi:hypothetical protein
LALPAVAIPIALGAASAGGAIFRASAAKKQAEATMPKAFEDELRDLERRARTGNLGLTVAQRGMLESEAAGQRAGLLADQQARQLQQAQSNAAFSGREMFLQDVGAAQAQGDLMAQQARQIRQAELVAEEQNRQMMRELQQREADAEAARKMANRQLAADLLGVTASTAAAAYGSTQLTKTQNDLLTAMKSGDQNAAKAAAQQLYMQQAMGFANSFGGR